MPHDGEEKGRRDIIHLIVGSFVGHPSTRIRQREGGDENAFIHALANGWGCEGMREWRYDVLGPSLLFFIPSSLTLAIGPDSVTFGLTHLVDLSWAREHHPI